MLEFGSVGKRIDFVSLTPEASSSFPVALLVLIIISNTLPTIHGRDLIHTPNVCND